MSHCDLLPSDTTRCGGCQGDGLEDRFVFWTRPCRYCEGRKVVSITRRREGSFFRRDGDELTEYYDGQSITSYVKGAQVYRRPNYEVDDFYRRLGQG